MKVLMYPHPLRIKNPDNGIAQVVLNYGKYAPQFGIDYVTENDSYDLIAVHAGMMKPTKTDKLVCHNHGLMWTGDREGARWEYEANRNVIDSIRNAVEITVPSSWVAQTFKRDMHLSPWVVPHGINWQEWQHNYDPQGYILWNKNRQTTTCDPQDVTYLATKFPNVHFVSTFGQQKTNVQITGKLPFVQMKKAIQCCNVYLATTKETGGIGIMEAMATGKPILGYRTGAITDIVMHGVNGYLAINKEDLAQGLIYCLENADTLGENSRELAKAFTWQSTMEQVAQVYESALNEQEPTVSIIIPCYNYAEFIQRAIYSATQQSYGHIEKIIVVDDGSTDNTKEVVTELMERDNRIEYVYQNNSGVAVARNNGISRTNSKYICCLDADDQILSQFIETCVEELEKDRTLGIAYTKLRLISRDGTKEARKAADWPTRFSYDNQFSGLNQIPTCCVFRRKAWERVGGYRQRYAPKGCGSEDAEMWLRIGAIGYDAKLVTETPLFIYSFGGRTTARDSDYEEINWLHWHPWTRDYEHPFASVAKPRKEAHKVRSYDKPLVSVIIPVGPGHEKHVLNALDSLEAQTFRKWEGIVVWDSPNTEILEQYKVNFPFITWIKTSGAKGAGFARNRGVELSKADIITFLDADDWFYPEFLEKTLQEFFAQGGNVGIYTDAVGKAILSQESVKKAKAGTILFYDPQTQEAVIAKRSEEYDWARAVKQPDERDMYIWNYVSTVIPKSWHNEIDGFDENMVSWEDWLYWIELARKGKCFIHLKEELMVYPFYSGNRRENGKKEWTNLVAYMKSKLEGTDVKNCTGCGGGGRSPPPRPPIRRTTNILSTMNSEGNRQVFNFESDMVMITYTSPNRGDHRVIGHATFQQPIQGLRMVNVGGALRIDYGYHGGGSRFLVHQAELQVAPHLFQAVSQQIPEIQIAAQTRKQEIPPTPQKLVTMPLSMADLEEEDLESDSFVEPEQKAAKRDKEFDLQTVPGVTADIASQLKEAGVDLPEDILDLGIDGLKGLHGVGEKKAELIFGAVTKRLAE